MSEQRTIEPKYDDLPTGTVVLAFPGSRDGRAIYTKTRSEPWTLPSGERVVMVNGYPGGIALSHIEVMPNTNALAVAESIAYEHAATVDGEFGCCHDEAALRAGGRVPEWDGDEFDPIPDDCLGQQALDRHLAAIASATSHHPRNDETTESEGNR